MKLRIFCWIVRTLRNGRAIAGVSESLFLADIDDFIGHRLVFEGGYERCTLALARRLMSQGGVFLDIGANIGLYSVLISEHEGTEVISFEPDSYNFEMLKTNIDLNCRINLTLCNTFLSSNTGIFFLGVALSNNRGSIRAISGSERDNSGNTTIVHSATTFDSVASALLIDKVVLVKMDVEGHELDVLRGFDWTKSYKPRNIICEYKDHNSRENFFVETEVYRFLISLGYVAKDIFGNTLLPGDSIPEDNVWFELGGLQEAMRQQ